MSQLLINQFLNDLDRLRMVSGTNRETVVREAFKDLLKNWAKSHELVFIPEYDFETPAKERRQVDGALLYSLRVPFGYWEAKDEDDDLDKEIDKKKRRGYPQDNIIFEDSRTAVLIQNRQEIFRTPVEDTLRLERLLELFFSYERPEIAQFRKAVEQFKADLPAVLDALRGKIEEASKSNAAFKKTEKKFLDHAKDTINPAITLADVREMLIQHILTEEIFSKVFDDGEFHRQNNIAKELYALEEKFFTGAAKRQTLKQLEPYYAAIRTAASQITSHAEKQTFLKVIYENFYKVYNPKAADRLGVIYTPNEIVRFMIESADWLCEKHFGKSLVDKGVEILDPATGTGTFICELLEHFRGNKQKLADKYKEELHANEVAILPYYVANLNIEATYAAITGQYAEFPNLCFVDTLDNVAGLGKFSGHQEELFGAMSEENVERIKRQNSRKISVIIGNPPYNAWQESYNDGNPNRFYKRIDQRIAETYVKLGTGQNQNSLYDMYTRFIRWASDRLDNEGVIALIVGRKPISKGAYNGFRKVISDEFAEVRIVDLGGDVIENPRLSGTKHNVFGIKVGVAILLLVKSNKNGRCDIHYFRRPEDELAEDKLSFLSSNGIQTFKFDPIKPNRKNDWLNQAEISWENFVPLIDDTNRRKTTPRMSQSVFQIMSSGLQTKQDDWAFDIAEDGVSRKMSFLIEAYNVAVDKGINAATSIKWHRELDRRRQAGQKLFFSEKKLRRSLYRPFSPRFVYFDRETNSQSFRLHEIFKSNPNPTITFLGKDSSNPLAALACIDVFDTCLLKNGNGSTQGAPLHRYTPDGSRLDNITDWALEQFGAHYEKSATPSPLAGQGGPAIAGSDEGATGRITKDAIFHYVYAVLHDPIYREKYALNLKREFPRIPFYDDFWRWADWGESLMTLHIGYETATPWPLKRIDAKDEKAQAAGLAPKTILKADKDHGIISLDSETQLSGVPKEAWDYKLGNRSALEWILDQYKEKTPKDPTIRDKFNTYRFADYKEKVVDLLTRVTRVSVETQKIVEAMRALERPPA